MDCIDNLTPKYGLPVPSPCPTDSGNLANTKNADPQARMNRRLPRKVRRQLVATRLTTNASQSVN
jgi:hypothetical protein